MFFRNKPKINHTGVRTWIEVDTKALKNNYDFFRRLVPKTCKIMAVVKSNAYGHGLYDYAPVVESFGVDFLGVDSITEAIKLQKKGSKKPILVLGYTLPERLRDAIERGISLTVSTFETLEALEKFHYSRKKFKIHLKIDTGMHRQGFFPEDVDKVVDYVKNRLPQVEIEGIYTHFADAGCSDGQTDTLKQIDAFKQACDVVEKAGFTPIRHAAATAGTLNYPEAHFDMVRIGIGLMGLLPNSNPTYASPSKGEENKGVPLLLKEGQGVVARKDIPLRSALSWRTVVSEIKNLPKGSTIGYGFTETLVRDSKIAILPIGYWQGFPRALSGKGQVLIKGKRCKVLGRVSMDMVMVDVTGLQDVQVGDIATLIGSDSDETITAYEVAELANSYHYELLTRINPLIKKIYY